MIKFFTPLMAICLFSSSIFPVATYAKGGLNYQRIKQFIPDGYSVLDTASGDFNKDGYLDCIIVLKSNNEVANPNAERPMLLLAGMAKGKFELVARNDKAVLCANCGGVFGDPYQKVSISDQSFSIVHSVGGNMQWSRVITFKYNNDTKEIVLEGDIIKTYQKSAPVRQKSLESNKSDFGNLTFASYSYNKGF